MNDQPMHMLTQMGILTSFSISKRITEKEMEMAMRAEKNKGKSEDEIISIMGESIINDIVSAVQNKKIPGMLVEEKSSKKPLIPIQNIEDLNRLVLVLNTKLPRKKYDKLSLCYFINYLVGALGLKEEDFEEFHRKIREARDDDEDDE
jgi:hypothetical protein